MTKIELLVVIAAAVLACSSEVEESEQKKRGAGKTTTLNAIPTGAQKPEYTYNIYSQNPSSQSGQTPTYQSQVPNSFYPSQSSQYYAPASVHSEQAAYPQQPHINLIPPTTSSQFVPLNFIPNPGYQTKYQVVPAKSANGNIQLTFLQQPNYQSPILQYPQTLLQPGPSHQYPTQQNLLASIPQGNFNVPSNYQPLSLGGSYLGQPSTMLLFAQPNPYNNYNNLLYQNPLQSNYNYYYPSNTQAKYGGYTSSSPQTTEYEKTQVAAQSISKEDNDIASHNTEYVSASDTSYKNPYSQSRGSSYSKLK
ncbi:hypothetical protein evm_008356 [Chilo suppressalis]|nr:hypothetical protein evm_008356 [Chilo suppressalis]